MVKFCQWLFAAICLHEWWQRHPTKLLPQRSDWRKFFGIFSWRASGSGWTHNWMLVTSVQSQCHNMPVTDKCIDCWSFPADCDEMAIMIWDMEERMGKERAVKERAGWLGGSGGTHIIYLLCALASSAIQMWYFSMLSAKIYIRLSLCGSTWVQLLKSLFVNNLIVNLSHMGKIRPKVEQDWGKCWTNECWKHNGSLL